MSAYHPQAARRPAPRSGAAAVEFALLAPLLALLVLGLLEMGRVLEVQQVMTNAAREAGRLATGGAPEADVTAHVRAFLRNAGLSAATADSANVTVDAAHTTAQGHHGYQITVVIPSDEVCWVPLFPVMGADASLTAEAIWVRD